MFSVNHFIWLGITITLIVGSLIYLEKTKPSMKDVLSVCCCLCVASEVVKTLSMLQIVPSGDGSRMFLYIEQNHMPLHLCSIQILLIFAARFMKRTKAWHILMAFMYPTTAVGAMFALALPSVFDSTVTPAMAFLHPIVYQTFLYHAMLVVLGIYIYRSGEVEIKPVNYWTTLGILFGLAYISLYLNSMFGQPVYQNGELISVEFTPNFFFTYRTPIGIALTEKWHWYVYMLIIIALAFITIGLFYLPVFIKAKKEKKGA